MEVVILINPCGECIVDAMCKDPCEELNEYLKVELPPSHNYWVTRVAEYFRNGKCGFCYLGHHILKVIYYE